MIGQLFLSAILLAVAFYAWAAFRKAPAIALTVGAAAIAGFYFVWQQDHATWLAQKAGIGRGVDLIIYIWVVFSLLAILNLHLALRAQTELITKVARRLALSEAKPPAVRPKGSKASTDEG